MFGKKFFFITFAFLFGVVVAIFIVFNLGKASYKISADENITLSFNKEIEIESEMLIEPFIKAEVQTSGLLGIREIKIIPESELTAGGSFDISFKYRKLFSDEILNFKDTVVIPINSDIESFEINEIGGMVSVNPKITLKISGEEGHDYSVNIVEYPITWQKNVLGNNIEFTAEESLPLGTTFTFALLDNGEILNERKLTTSDQPRIAEITNKKYFVPGDVVDIYFNKAMDIKTNPLNIDAPGDGKWMSETYYSFTLGDITPDGKYLFELTSGSKAKDGTTVIDSQSFVISAPGELEMIMTHFEDDSQIKIEFNQPVDKEEFEFKFLTVPKINGDFTWQDDTVFFNMKGLAYETKYNVTVARGITTLYGISNKNSQNISFTTEPMPFKNDIPLAKTKYLKGGSLATVVNVLGYYKIKTDEDTVLQKMGQDISVRTGNIWGDPRKVFVGPHNSSSGYGVHTSVLARVISSYGRSVKVLNSPTVSSIAKEVKDGNVVIVISADGVDSWQTKDGVNIKAGRNIKTQIVSGVYGKSVLRGFFLHDSATGEKFKYINASSMTSLLKNVSGVTDQVIVVK